jgi:hypothetical protein
LKKGVRRRGAHPNETGWAMQAAKRPHDVPQNQGFGQAKRC